MIRLTLLSPPALKFFIDLAEDTIRRRTYAPITPRQVALQIAWRERNREYILKAQRERRAALAALRPRPVHCTHPAVVSFIVAGLSDIHERKKAYGREHFSQYCLANPEYVRAKQEGKLAKQREISRRVAARKKVQLEEQRPKPETWAPPVWQFLVGAFAAELGKQRAGYPPRSSPARATLQAQRKAWRKANPDRHAAHKAAWRRNRRAQRRPEDLLLSSLRRRLVEAVRQKRGHKSANTLALLGCTIPELRARLEGLFAPGMSWDNYGPRTWHIDHVKPCAKFDLTQPDQQRACFHYTNLQPLWAEDNILKGDKYDVAA